MKTFVSTMELSKISKVKGSTIKYYSEVGILPYFKTSKELKAHKYYKAFDSCYILKNIKIMKDKGYNIAMIKTEMKNNKYTPQGDVNAMMQENDYEALHRLKKYKIKK